MQSITQDMVDAASIVAEKINLDDFRPSNTYEPIDVTTFPSFETSKDCLQFAQELVRSEIDFWKEGQRALVSAYSRLRVIVPMLAKNLMNINLRLKVLSNPDDFNAYQIYKAYTSLIDSLNPLQNILELGEENAGESEQQLIEKIISGLNKEKDRQRSDIRSLSKVYKDPRSNERAPTGRFGAQLEDSSTKYALCDAEYTPQIFCPALISLFQKRLEAVKPKSEVSEWLKGTAVDKMRAQQGKKKGKKKKKRGGEQQKRIALSLQDKREQEETPLDHKGTEVAQVHPKSYSNGATAKTKDNLSTSSEQPSGPPDVIHFPTVKEKSEANETTLPILSKKEELPRKREVSDTSAIPALSGLNQGDEFITSKDLEGADSAQVRDPFTSWDKPKKGKENKKKEQPKTIALSAESAKTVERLLGNADVGRENVEMKHFVKLLIELGGNASRGGKCIHYWARSPITDKWCSVAMHPLHGDKKSQIPRNTPYWKTAQSLLIELGFDKLDVIVK